MYSIEHKIEQFFPGMFKKRGAFQGITYLVYDLPITEYACGRAKCKFIPNPLQHPEAYCGM
ncbi:MAG TPA: hypothetical protein DCE41_26415 [Cytophagales bacterium]|nr:hypothetical protein [Cytophagales bacterium]